MHFYVSLMILLRFPTFHYYFCSKFVMHSIFSGFSAFEVEITAADRHFGGSHQTVAAGPEKGCSC